MKLITKETEFITETQTCGVYGFSAAMPNREKLRAMLDHDAQTIHGRIVRTYRVADVLEARKNRYADTMISIQPKQTTA